MASRELAGLVAVLALIVPARESFAQVRRPEPLPQGARIAAQNGDIIVLEGDAQVKILRRRDANVRVVFSPSERWLVLLVDYAAKGGPDGLVDWMYSYTNVTGDWPMEERWEGPTTIEEYSTGAMGPGPAAHGIGFTGSRGLVQLFPMPSEEFRDPAAAAVLRYQGSSGAIANRLSFDQAEAQTIQAVRRNARNGTQVQTSSGGVLSFGVIGPTENRPLVDGMAPVRVGGSVRQPEKLVNVEPVLPETAARAGIRGIVILEATIGVDGTVKDARVLRSIPLLDAAALDAVRQWRFAPTILNGQAVPVIMTVPVPFQ